MSLTGLKVGQLMLITGPCIENWATEQRSDPNLGSCLFQIRVNTSQGGAKLIAQRP
jgi:hypothetical protein